MSRPHRRSKPRPDWDDERTWRAWELKFERKMSRWARDFERQMSGLGDLGLGDLGGGDMGMNDTGMDDEPTRGRSRRSASAWGCGASRTRRRARHKAAEGESHEAQASCHWSDGGAWSAKGGYWGVWSFIWIPFVFGDELLDWLREAGAAVSGWGDGLAALYANTTFAGVLSRVVSEAVDMSFLSAFGLVGAAIGLTAGLALFGGGGERRRVR
ncbi:MAG: hypothetical protein ACFB2Z_08550 [Maricaulaceae bacterium]